MKKNKKDKMILGFSRVSIYWTIKIVTLIILVIIVWNVALPNLLTTLNGIISLIKETLASDSTPEFKLILLCVSFYLVCMFISIGIRLYEKISELAKEYLL